MTPKTLKRLDEGVLMSRTDKTDPYWVQIRYRDTNTLRAFHRHFGSLYEEHGCQIAYPVPRYYPSFSNWKVCEWWPRYKEYNKFFGRRPNKATRKAIGFEAKNRMELRKLRRDWRLESIREDIDSTYGAPRRRCQVRDPWHWD